MSVILEKKKMIVFMKKSFRKIWVSPLISGPTPLAAWNSLISIPLNTLNEINQIKNINFNKFLHHKNVLLPYDF